MNNNTNHQCRETGCARLDTAIQRLTLALTDPDLATAMAKGIDQQGAGFAAFVLAASDVDITDAELIQQFNARHVGTFSGWDELRYAYLAIIGYAPDVDRLEDGHGKLLGGFLRWDDEAVQAYLRDRFEVIEADDRLFVFEPAEHDSTS